MIQDIAPHVYDRTYRRLAAGPQDCALCCAQGRVLLLREEGVWRVPRFADFPAGCAPRMTDARHIFRIDGTDCFLAEPPQGAPVPADEMLADCPLPEEFVWCSVQEVRAVRPMAAAFAAITALQLHRWYKSRSFCGRCGAPTEPSCTERAMVCPKCGLIEYPKICPAVIVAVSDGERLLVSRYRDRPFRGWALIAGFVEIGETLEDTVRREVLEETGLRVKNLRYYKSQPWSFSDTLLAGFYCDLDGSDAIGIEEDELSEALWLPRGEIPPRGNDVSLTAEMMERFRLGQDGLPV